MSRQVDCAGVDQIAALQHGRRQPQQKAQQLLVFRLVTQTEVIFEAHAGRNEIEQRHAHAARRMSSAKKSSPSTYTSTSRRKPDKLPALMPAGEVRRSSSGVMSRARRASTSTLG